MPISVPANKATVDLEQWRQTLEALRLIVAEVEALKSQQAVIR